MCSKKLCSDRVEYLGNILTGEHIAPSPNKVKGIHGTTPPDNVRVSYLARFNCTEASTSAGLDREGSRMRHKFFLFRPYFVKNECAPHLPQAFFLLALSGRLIVSNLPHGDLAGDTLAERPLLVEPGQNGLCPIEKCDVVARVPLPVTESCKAARIPKICSRK